VTHSKAAKTAATLSATKITDEDKATIYQGCADVQAEN
jgi:hypothetical protein